MFFKSKARSKYNRHTQNRNVAASPATRVVTSDAWVPVSQLELGMYVSELDTPWEQTSFMFQGFIIDSYATLKAIKNVSQYANVQIRKTISSS